MTVTSNSRGNRLRAAAYCVGVAGLAAFLLAPLAAILPVSFSRSQLLIFPPEGFTLKWYYQIFESGVWSRGILTTLLLASGSALAAVALGFSTAYWLELTRPSVRKLVPLLLFMPVIIPAPLMALAYYVGCNMFFGLPSFVSLLIAYSFSGMPYAFLAARLGFLKHPVRLDEAASLMGASAWQIFFQVRLRASYRSLASGFVLAFLVALDDVIFAFFLADTKTRTLNLLLWDGIRTSLSPVVAAISVLLLFFGLLLAVSLSRARATASAST